MVIDKYREATCPNCGENYTVDVIVVQRIACTCGKTSELTEDEIDGSLRYFLKILPEEEVYKWGLPLGEVPYFEDFISFNDDNQK